MACQMPSRVDPARDLPDQHRRERFPELLMDAEEVDLGAADHVVAHAHVSRDGRDEGAQELPLRIPTCHSFFHPGDSETWMNSTVNDFAPCRRRNAPTYHFSSEFEYLNPEHGLVVFDVVLVQQLLDLLRSRPRWSGPW